MSEEIKIEMNDIWIKFDRNGNPYEFTLTNPGPQLWPSKHFKAVDPNKELQLAHAIELIKDVGAHCDEWKNREGRTEQSYSAIAIRAQAFLKSLEEK